MSILETFYIMFKADADGAVDGIKGIDKAADGAEKSVEDLDAAFKAAARNAKEMTLAADRARTSGAANAGDLAKQAKEAQLNARALGLELDKTKDAMTGMENSADDLGSSVVGMGKSLIAPAAILATLGSIASAALDRAAEIRELDQFSSKLNSSIGDVDAFQRSVKAMGGETAGAVDSLVKIGERVNEAFSDAESGARKDFELWGLAFKDAEGGALGASDAMLELAGNLENVSRAEALARIKKLGIEDAATIDLLLKGRAAVEAKIAAEKKLGVVTEKQARITREYYTELGGLSNRMLSLGNDLVSAVIPAATSVISAFSAAFDWLRENQQFVEGFFIGIAAVITAVYLPAIMSAAAATLIALAPYLAIAAAIAAVGVAFALAYDDVKSFLNGQPSLIGELVNKYEWFANIVDGIGAVFTGLRDGGVAALTALGEAWDLIVIGVGIAWDAVSSFFKRVEPLFSAWFDLISSLGDLWMAVAEQIVEGVGSALEWLGDKLAEVRDFAATLFEPMLDALQPAVDAITAAAAAIKDGMISAFTAIRAVWDATLGAIVSGIRGVTDRVQSLTNWIRGVEAPAPPAGVVEQQAPSTGTRNRRNRRPAPQAPNDAEQQAPSTGTRNRRNRRGAANDNPVTRGQAMLKNASAAPITGQTAQSIVPAVTNNDVKNTVEVGAVTVHTAAVDAQGMAAAANKALQRELRGTAAQFDDGVAS